ncbi:calcium-activated chloride channel regulator 1-like [Chiloscyllium punctatum]|uniref:calcium-activated chloride channel regulator 1-like n=1 Tax=Chiloscyllium punctatum TaxID=137246 RepID=UPI003B63F22A
MKSIKLFLLSLVCLVCVYGVSCSDVKLVNNGYENVVIAINPGIPEDPMLITKIQEMVRSASNFLYKATKHRAYFRDVKILLPITWSSQPHYQRPSTQSYEKANVIIANPHTQYGDDPYTLQYGQCGDKGRYIHFTQNFMLNDSLIQVYGERGSVLVHEWAHLRWGVFDEYNDLAPFYAVGDTYEATRCSKEIKGLKVSCSEVSCGACDPSTGLPDTDCNFFPDQNQVTSTSIMYTTGLPGVVDFCDNKTHNREAPNMQNKMCDERSTWDVISKSDDFKNNHPTNITSLEPKFTFLHAKDRVLCLVLDTSGSMDSKNRIERLRQAAGIFLLQIIEDQSYVGIVGFHSYATEIQELTVIESEDSRKKLKNLLPKIASGGTNICAGVQAGFQVLRSDDGVTNGDEIVLLTDGEDGGISNCFSEVKQSGAVIHTIALGLNAAIELEQLSSMTGGLQYAATDKLDENGLVDAFTGLVSGNGDMSQQSIQLESSGKSIASNDWFNGTVFIDKSVGKNTFFVITWETYTPQMFIRDPNGKLYRNGNFEMDRVLLTARLPIPGLAHSGAWMYSIQNGAGMPQVVTITVTSRAADENIPPVTVNAHLNQDTTSYPKPLIIFAEVSQGFLPVVGANVTATVERAEGQPVNLELLDNGGGADAVRNDGVYSRYFIEFLGNGRYTIKVSVQGKDGIVRLTTRKQSHAMYIPGYVQNGQIHPNPPKPPVDRNDSQIQLGSFNRVKTAGACVVSQVPDKTPPDMFPPSKIKDLRAAIVGDAIQLKWTAPGDDLDQGTASFYEIKLSKSFTQLRDDFPNAQSVNTTGLKPRVANSEESFTVSENIELKNGTVIYFAIRAFDKENQSSALSNIAQAALILASPPPTSQPVQTIEPTQPHNSVVINISEILVIVGIVVIVVSLIISITVCVVTKKRQGRVSPSEEMYS